MSKRRLGKGIDALLQGRPLDQLSQLSSIVQVPIGNLEPNPHQPRKTFSEDSLRELADSISEHGIIQPILAEDRGDGTYIIIAGERRFRAAKIAGLEEVPVINQDFTDDEKLEIALIENIQREDLNPIDEALAMQSALELSGSTQDQLAKRLGKSRSAVANALRLLRLDDDIKAALASGTLSAGHARQLVSLSDNAARRELFRAILDESLNVRDTEARARALQPDATAQNEGAEDRARATGKGGTGRTTPTSTGNSDPNLKILEDVLLDHFGTRVTIRGTSEGGKLEIGYTSGEDLERIIELMGVSLK